MFEASAFADTLTQTRHDLDDIAAGVEWLAPAAYEQRTGGKGGASACRKCHDRGRRPIGCACKNECTCPPCPCKGTARDALGDDCTRCEPCNECVVAIIGDVGEIVLRRGHLADQLDQLAADAEKVWAAVKGMGDRIAKLAALIDRGASTDERWGPPTVDHREAAAAWAAKGRRVARGDDRAPLRGVEKEARERLDQFRRQQEAVRQAAEKAAAGKENKVRNKWTGAR